MKAGWFQIKGITTGPRTVAEQMKGLSPALHEARGKSVLDLGSAEGCIAIEFAKFGAQPVDGVEFNPELLEIAQTLSKDVAGVRIIGGDLNDALPPTLLAQYDIVLALAIAHKMREPSTPLRQWCAAARHLVVIRLPGGSTGAFKSKFSNGVCDTNQVMPECGFELEETLPGPRDELVQYWRRKWVSATR